MTLQVNEPSAKYLVRPQSNNDGAGIPPNGWQIKPLGKLSEFITSGSRGWATYYKEHGATFIRSQNVLKGQLDFNDHQCVVPPVGSEGSRTRVEFGDLLITITGNSVGNVAYVDRPLGEAYISQHVGLVRLKNSESAAYICRFLSPGAPGNSQIVSNQSGQSKPGLNLKNLRDFVVSIPPKEEQLAIAATLSDVDALIAGLEKLIAKKRDLKQAAMQQLLTGQTRLPGFSGDWDYFLVDELEKLGLLKLSRGNVISKKDIDATPGDCPIYSSSVKNDGEFGRYGHFMFDEELITWSVDGGGNFFYRAKHRFSVTNVCGYMRADSKRLNYRYLAAQLQFEHGKKSFDYQSKAHPSVVRAEYLVPVPKHEEQTAIATAISDMDTDLSALEARLTKTRSIKQGMMQELLTGRTRLV